MWKYLFILLATPALAAFWYIGGSGTDSYARDLIHGHIAERLPDQDPHGVLEWAATGAVRWAGWGYRHVGVDEDGYPAFVANDPAVGVEVVSFELDSDPEDYQLSPGQRFPEPGDLWLPTPYGDTGGVQYTNAWNDWRLEYYMGQYGVRDTAGRLNNSPLPSDISPEVPFVHYGYWSVYLRRVPSPPPASGRLLTVEHNFDPASHQDIRQLIADLPLMPNLVVDSWRGWSSNVIVSEGVAVISRSHGMDPVLVADGNITINVDDASFPADAGNADIMVSLYAGAYSITFDAAIVVSAKSDNIPTDKYCRLYLSRFPGSHVWGALIVAQE